MVNFVKAKILKPFGKIRSVGKIYEMDLDLLDEYIENGYVEVMKEEEKEVDFSEEIKKVQEEREREIENCNEAELKELVVKENVKQEVEVPEIIEEKPEEKSPDFVGYDNFIKKYVKETPAVQFQAVEDGAKKFNISKTRANSLLNIQIKEYKAQLKIKRDKEKQKKLEEIEALKKKEKIKEDKKKQAEIEEIEKIKKQKKQAKEFERQEKERLAEEKRQQKLAIRQEKEAEEEAKEEQKKLLLDQLEMDWKTCGWENFIQVFEFDERKAQHYTALRLMQDNKYSCFEDTKTLLKYVKEGPLKGSTTDNAEIFVQEELQKNLLEKATDFTIKEITNKIKRSTYVDREILSQQPKHLIPIKNGLFNLETKELEEFSSEYIFLNKFPFKYSKSAKCEKFKKYLEEVLTHSPKDILVTQEFLGDILQNNNSFHKAVLLHGDGANGKSVLMKFLKFFIGYKNVTSISLQALEKNTFAVARLFGKKANIFFDLPKSALSSTSIFKMVVSGDPLTGEHKGQDSFEFTPFCKMMFSCNDVPRTPDQSPAFFRRWIVLTFPEHFPEGDPRRIENLEEQFFEENELSGIFNFALEGLERLHSQKRYTENMSQSEITDFWLRKSDSVASFKLDCIVKDTEGHPSKEEVYDNYETFCQVGGYTPEPQNAFWRRLKDLCPYMIEMQHKEGTFRNRLVNGVRLVPVEVQNE